MCTPAMMEEVEELFGVDIRQDVREHGVERALQNWGTFMKAIIYEEQLAIYEEERVLGYRLEEW